MDHETLFTASKWDILKRLESGASSPLELSKVCKTSIANVSQQLRLLEMAGLVTSKRISNRDKGKPRVLYTLAGNLSYMISTSNDFVEKKVLPLSRYNKIIMRIWFYEKAHLHYVMEKAFWKIEEKFSKINYLAIDTERESPVTFFVGFKGKGTDLKPFTITDKHGTKHQVVFTTARKKANAYVLYDPRGESPEKSDGGNSGK